MAIVPSTNYQPSLSERQEHMVMTMLDDAANSPTSIDTHSLAERILGEVRELEITDHETHIGDDLDRLHMLMTHKIMAALDMAEGMSAADLKEADTYQWASDIACGLRDEVARGPEFWRDADGRDRAASSKL